MLQIQTIHSNVLCSCNTSTAHSACLQHLSNIPRQLRSSSLQPIPANWSDRCNLPTTCHSHFSLNLANVCHLLLLHPFPRLCGVDVSYESPPFSPLFLPGQFSLRQVVPDAIQPHLLRSFSPSFPRHLYHHHSLAYVFVFSSQYMPYHVKLLSCTFLDVSPTFVVPLILSFLILSSLLTPHIHLDILISYYFSCAFFTAPVDHCWSKYTLVHFPLDPPAYSSVTQHKPVKRFGAPLE